MASPVLVIWPLLFVGQAPVRDLRVDDWVAPMESSQFSAPKKRFVGMFYFLANHVPNAPIFDITKILAANPKNPEYGPFGTNHWWGEPWFGYYQSDDPWVIRKHMQMLANAGVDVLVFDNTNGPTYPDVYLPLCNVLEQMKQEGLKAPQIAFFTGHGAWQTLENDFYSKGTFRDLWFQWKGKPLMMVHLDGGDKLPAQIRSEFTVRESWAWTTGGWFGDGRDKWAWLDNYPQNPGWHDSKTAPEELSVTVGQHATSGIGRSSSHQKEPAVEDLRLTPVTNDAVCFTEQFDRALQIDPEFTFVTGWNEWTATRFKADGPGMLAGRPEPAGGSVFVDEYNAEFSRDIEPSKGLLQDDDYYRLIDYVRRYKGRSASPVLNSERRIQLDGPMDQWRSVVPEYFDPVGDVVHRDHPGWGSEKYVNDTGRNDIVSAKVAYDPDNVYFYVHANGAISPHTDPNWMLLYLNVPNDPGPGARWLGYNFVVNRKPGDGRTTIERNVGGEYRWEVCGTAEYRVKGADLLISVPRKTLSPNGKIGSLQFKWADNIAQTGEASDFTVHGDVAPDDRFNYLARFKK